MTKLAIFGAATGCLLLFMLASASGNTTLLAGHYWLLLFINGAILMGLLVVVGLQLWRLRELLHAQVFGAKLTLRLVLMFALVTVLPGALVYTVSMQFLTRSIETWFDVRVDKALDRSLELGHVALRSQLAKLDDSADHFESLGWGATHPLAQQLNQLRESSEVAEAAVFSTNGSLLAFSKPGGGEPAVRPDAAMLAKVLTTPYHAIETTSEATLSVRVLRYLPVAGERTRALVLQLIQPVPKVLAEDAELVERVRGEYKQVSLSREGLKVIYSLTLTLTLVLSLLAGLALAFMLSERLSAPLRALAAGTRAVAQGDFTQRQPVMSSDELGSLTQSFNLMTRQLADVSETVERKQQQLEAANAYLEGVLLTLTTGVMALDERFRLRAINPSASAILQLDLEKLRNIRMQAWSETHASLDSLAHVIADGFGDADVREWQQQIEFPAKGGTLTLLVRGARLKSAEQNGVLVVFDDVSDLMQAQRDAAWGEVAKRLAHEIKNPLTPIQLSAERLQRRLSDKLEPADADMLARATQTIVKQVAELNKMVDAFKEYARQPRTRLRPIDLNSLVSEVIALYEATGIVHADLAPEPLPVLADATLMRQVIHNLLQNAQDAVQGTTNPRVSLQSLRREHDICLIVTDNGPGVSEEMLGRVFEPYVTTKSKGTGLGLAIVKKIVDEHNGVIQIENIDPNGARVKVELPLINV